MMKFAMAHPYLSTIGVILVVPWGIWAAASVVGSAVYAAKPVDKPAEKKL